MQPIRVLLIDDHRMLTDAVARRLSAESDLWVAGQCTTDDPQLLELVARLRPDVVSVDVETVRTAATELIRRLQSTVPSIRIVVLTASRDPQLAADVAKSGAQAWVFKESSVEVFIDVLRGVSQGRASYPDEVLGAVLRELRASGAAAPAGPIDLLTSRERDVLLAMVRGKSAGQIAEELSLSTNTVRTHTRNILNKLNVHSRLAAIKVALDTGIQPDAATPAGAETTGHLVPFGPPTPGGPAIRRRSMRRVDRPSGC